MQLLASLFLPTYPDPPGPKVASNAVAVARQLGATLDAAVINVDIPDVPNALSGRGAGGRLGLVCSLELLKYRSRGLLSA
ncbi:MULTISPECIES: hypothetical protein [unclassified Mesorhizobium]|uniref:hypothetical protein n=1 Tax=unclassified Mesorhizobium TaxID=325217 RepID=UPI001672D8B0|nr:MULTISPECIES: hypothetical protein [unclassified Mesorhizobium]